MADLHTLGAAAAARAIAAGEITSEELVGDCLDRIAAVDDMVQAWAFLDREHALAQARAADQARKLGRPTGPLHGVPVGVKDIYDTADMPTENGSPLQAGRRPTRDATAVALLRAAGAVILGKTVTTEFAVYSPGKTRNPHDPERTPGGSSSGSAAAVAAGMAPLAIGSQTNGSVIRPAAFCGVWGWKPTHGLISRAGMLKQSSFLDHAGAFARGPEDLALVGEALTAFDAADPAMRPRARPDLVRVAGEPPPVAPRLAFVRTPVWDQAEEETHEAFAELVEALGQDVAEIELPEPFAEVVALHRTVLEADLAVSLGPEYERGAERISEVLRAMIERGGSVRAVDYARACEQRTRLNLLLDELFHAFDAILTPSAPGAAPRGLGSTGSPVFCTLWTFCGTPAVNVPVLQNEAGLPIGVQLVGQLGDDTRLLRTAKWLAERVAAA